MGVSSCNTCQSGGFESIQALNRAYQDKLNKEAQGLVPDENSKTGLGNQPEGVNNPIAGAAIGSQINIRA